MSIDRSSRQVINEETAALKDTLDQMNLINIFRAFHPKAAEHIYFSSAHGIFSRIDHMLRHKVSLNKFKNEIISSIFIYHNAMKLDINHKNTEKHSKTWKRNNMFLKNEWVNKEMKEEIQRYLETNENVNTTIENLWDSRKSFLREIHSITSLSRKKERKRRKRERERERERKEKKEKKRKSSNKPSNFTLKGT